MRQDLLDLGTVERRRQDEFVHERTSVKPVRDPLAPDAVVPRLRGKWELPGSTALVVPVPEAERLVGRYRRLHTPSGSQGMPAHVTLVSPFVPASRFDRDREAATRTLIATAAGFEFSLVATRRFERTLYLAPEPAAPFVELIEALADSFPEYPPYAGTVTEIVPHVTVAQGDDELALGQFAAALEPSLPVACAAVEATLFERREDGRFHARVSFPFGASHA
jgi:2'-5' RNA ligase superfamily